MHTLRLLWFVPSPIAVVADGLKLAPAVSLEAERNPSSDAQFEALASGRTDAVVTAMDNVMDWNLRPGPKDLVIVAQMEHTTPLTLMGRRGLARLSDLRNGTVLVDAARNGFVVALRAMLSEEGITHNDYTLESVGGVKERFDALVAGRGDATLLGPPFDVLALQAGLNRIASIQERYPAFPGQGLVVSAAQLPRLRSPLTAWLSGLDRARVLMHTDPQSAQQTLLDAGFPLPAVEVMLACAPRSLYPDRAGVDLLISQRRMAGLPGAETSYDRLVECFLVPTA